MKTIVFISDMQVGHRVAVAPPHAKITGYQSETEIELTDQQKALYAAWSQVARKWGNSDILVLNGEPIEGQQRKNMGVEVWSTNILDQMDAAETLVKMFHPRYIYATRGSDYHVTIQGVPIEEEFGRRVGAKKVDGTRAPYELFLDVEGVTFNIAHHVGSTRVWMYRSTSITREMALMQLNASHKWPADVFIRSHVHYYWYVGSTSHLALITPCWKLQDWFMHKLSSAGTVPDIGAVRFKVDNGKFDWDAMLFKFDQWRPKRVKV